VPACLCTSQLGNVRDALGASFDHRNVTTSGNTIVARCYMLAAISMCVRQVEFSGITEASHVPEMHRVQKFKENRMITTQALG